MKTCRRFAVSSLLLLACSAPLFAARTAERTQFGRDIHISAGEKTSDITCINCSIYLQGQSTGDVTAIHGNVTLETGSTVAGDVTAVWGNVRTESGTQIAGDLTAVAGSVRRDPQSNASGDVTSLEGTKWLLAIVVPPLVFLGGIIALIIWLVQRNRVTAPVPAYVSPSAQPTTRT